MKKGGKCDALRFRRNAAAQWQPRVLTLRSSVEPWEPIDKAQSPVRATHERHNGASVVSPFQGFIISLYTQGSKQRAASAPWAAIVSPLRGEEGVGVIEFQRHLRASVPPW